MKKLIFIDTETTGNTPSDVLCQIAYKLDGTEFCELYKPAIPIPPEASAITHITNKHVADKPSFKESRDYQPMKDLLEDNDSIFIAHNAKFDLGMMHKEDIYPKNFICTLRCARGLDKEGKISQYGLQYLRYLLEIEVDAQAHDALGDVRVLEKLFERLYKKAVDQEGSEDKAITKMLEMSSHPSLMRDFNFGKHKGKSIEEVSKIDSGYLQWLLNQKLEQSPDDEDWIYTLKHYLGMLH